MKCLKKMKLKNKWMILLAGAFFLAVGGFTHTSSLVAAEADEDALMTMDFLHPFDLTVSSLSVSSASTDDFLVSAAAPAPASYSYSSYAQPLKIWIPYRPTFRSPCVPSW